MLDNIVYLVVFSCLFFGGLGVVSLVVEKVPFFNKMSIKIINSMIFNEENKIPEDWDGKDEE